jgi:hypothetical protein
MNQEYQKPVSISLSELFIKKTSVSTITSESVVEAVIKHQWKSANEATQVHNEVEVSGLGKFYVSENKTKKRIARLELIKQGYQKVIAQSNDERRINITINKLKAVQDRIDKLKYKLGNEY